VSLTARALTTRAGHPVLKLVLLTVAASNGFPTAADVAEASELTLGMTENALTDLIHARLLVPHRGPSGTRYGLPDDGWSYTRADTDDGSPDPLTTSAAPLPPSFDGLGTHLFGRRARRAGRA
jgi:hypothetical protein